MAADTKEKITSVVVAWSAVDAGLSNVQEVTFTGEDLSFDETSVSDKGVVVGIFPTSPLYIIVPK